MSNVLNEEKKQQVIALGKLGWTLRRIEQATGVRRETISTYLKAAGVAIRQPGGWGRRAPAKPANGVITDSAESKPANEAGVITDFIRPFSQKQPLPLRRPNPSASTCEPYRATIELGLSRGRNAMAHLAGHGDRVRIQRRLPNRAAFHRQAAWIAGTRTGWNHHHSARRREPGRLRHGADGPRCANGASTGGRDYS